MTFGSHNTGITYTILDFVQSDKMQNNSNQSNCKPYKMKYNDENPRLTAKDLGIPKHWNRSLDQIN